MRNININDLKNLMKIHNVFISKYDEYTNKFKFNQEYTSYNNKYNFLFKYRLFYNKNTDNLIELEVYISKNNSNNFEKTILGTSFFINCSNLLNFHHELFKNEKYQKKILNSNNPCFYQKFEMESKILDF